MRTSARTFPSLCRSIRLLRLGNFAYDNTSARRICTLINEHVPLSYLYSLTSNSLNLLLTGRCTCHAVFFSKHAPTLPTKSAPHHLHSRTPHSSNPRLLPWRKIHITRLAPFHLLHHLHYHHRTRLPPPRRLSSKSTLKLSSQNIPPSHLQCPREMACRSPWITRPSRFPKRFSRPTHPWNGCHE